MMFSESLTSGARSYSGTIICCKPLEPYSMSCQWPPDVEETVEEKDTREDSESESESSQKSQTGKDFEMVEREEVDS